MSDYKPGDIVYSDGMTVELIHYTCDGVWKFDIIGPTRIGSGYGHERKFSRILDVPTKCVNIHCTNHTDERNFIGVFCMLCYNAAVNTNFHNTQEEK